MIAAWIYFSVVEKDDKTWIELLEEVKDNSSLD